MNTPLPEIPESAASPHIASIYNDIRATQNMPLVNLIWRHLATMEDALPSTWQAIRPLYTSGTVQSTAAELFERSPELTPFPLADRALADVQLETVDVETIRALLATYNHGNSLNLVAFCALIERLRPGTQSSSVAPDQFPRVPQRSTLLDLGNTATANRARSVSLPFLGDLGADTVDRIVALNQLGLGGRDSPIVATLYRHLAHWPGYLDMIYAQLAPLEADGTLDRAIDDCRSLAFGLTAPLVKLMPLEGTMAADTAAAESLRAQVSGVIELFVSDAIARMVVIGTALASQFRHSGNNDNGNGDSGNGDSGNGDSGNGG